MRPTFEEIYMGMAEQIAMRSTCSRLSVGSVLTSTDFRYVLAVGYNGNASGLPNKCDSDEPGNCGCVHSEASAVANCITPRNVDKYLFCTTLNCKNCAKLLINLGGIKKIYYRDEYRKPDSKEIFSQLGIDLIQMPSPNLKDKQFQELETKLLEQKNIIINLNNQIKILQNNSQLNLVEEEWTPWGSCLDCNNTKTLGHKFNCPKY